jgi:hypothetical protein
MRISYFCMHAKPESRKEPEEKVEEPEGEKKLELETEP